MKRNNWFIKGFLSLLIGTFLFSSCEYRDYADADYPDNKIYFPTAANGVWTINKKTNENPSIITPGYTALYEINNNNFSVVLGVVQAGIYKSGSFDVSLALKTDTIYKMIQMGALPEGTVALQDNKLTFPSSVTFPKNSESVGFTVDFPLSEITGANAGKKVAFALTITDSGVEPNPDLQTTVVLVDSSFLK